MDLYIILRKRKKYQLILKLMQEEDWFLRHYLKRHLLLSFNNYDFPKSAVADFGLKLTNVPPQIDR